MLADRQEVGHRASRTGTPTRSATTKPTTHKPGAAKAKPVASATAAGAAVGSKAAAVIKFALAQVGKPYRWAAAGPGSYDCSGLVMAAYAKVGIALPHQTGGIVGKGRKVARDQLRPGDIVFPSSGHVAIYLGKGKIVHAPKPGDHVRVAALYAFYTARRLL